MKIKRLIECHPLAAYRVFMVWVYQHTGFDSGRPDDLGGRVFSQPVAHCPGSGTIPGKNFATNIR